jgi:hypothetical protein
LYLVHTETKREGGREKLNIGAGKEEARDVRKRKSKMAHILEIKNS